MTSWTLFSGDPERDRRNFVTLMDAIGELFGPRGLDEVAQFAVDRAIQVTQAERGVLLLDDGDGTVPYIARDDQGRDVPLTERYSQSVVDRVWTSGEAYKTVDAANPTAASLGASVLELKLLSIMATPLVAKGERFGVLYVHSTAHTKEFTHADFALFNVLGSVIAMAVLNARLISEALEKEKMERALGQAKEVQQRLLPADLRPPPGYDVAGAGRPCEEMSGDYYDVIRLPGDQVALVVGDVKGHGIGPALYMASTRALIRGLMGKGEDTLKIMDTLNEFLARDMDDDDFMSLFVGVLDAPARVLRYASAGHNPPILVRASGELEELERTGPVLSVIENATYGLSEPVRLASGDVLALYTDGIYEAHSADRRMYGEERFHASLRAHAGNGSRAESIVSGVLADLDAFRKPGSLDDDITLLVLRVL